MKKNTWFNIICFISSISRISKSSTLISSKQNYRKSVATQPTVDVESVEIEENDFED